jgi:hypothetical protein|tara:strand:- start:63 stop:206 length:144 start_codon:yes stop_codon:yes gene_type:complete
MRLIDLLEEALTEAGLAPTIEFLSSKSISLKGKGQTSLLKEVKTTKR